MFFAMFIINSIGFLFNGVEVIEAVVLIFNVWHGKLYETNLIIESVLYYLMFLPNH